MKSRFLLCILTLVLSVCCVVSLSSCDMAKEFLDSIKPDSSVGDEDKNDDDSDKNDAQGDASDDGDFEGDADGGPGDDTEDNDVSAGGENVEGGDAGDTGNTDGDEDEDDEIVFLPGGAQDAQELTSAQRALLSTVIVRPIFEVYNGYTTRTETINGSGVIYSLDRESGDAIIITNYHVVYYKESATEDGISEDIGIYLYGMEAEQYRVRATYIGGSLGEDIAVLRVEGSEVLKNSSALSVNIGSSSTAAVTDKVLAVGNPEGDGISASEGIISVNDETISMLGADGRTMISIRVIRVDSGINQGNSGGGLYDADGRLIGIVNAKKTGSDIDNIGWALPIDRVKNLVGNILDHCDGETVKTPKKALVGMTLYAAAMGVKIDETTGDLRRCELVEVHEVTDSCIIKDEIKVGDRILYTVVDGVRLDADRVHMVIDHLLTARVGSTLVLGVERDGAAFEITVTLTEECFVEIK